MTPTICDSYFCIILSCVILELVCVTNRIGWKWRCVISESRWRKTLWLPHPSSWLSQSSGKPAATSWGNPSYLWEAHVEHPVASYQLPSPACQLCDWATLDIAPPAPIKPSDDCNSCRPWDCNFIRHLEVKPSGWVAPKLLTHWNCEIINIFCCFKEPGLRWSKSGV